MFKKILISFITITICLSLFGCSRQETSAFTSKQIDIYYKTVDDKQSVEVFYKDNNNQIPYVSLDTYKDISNYVYNNGIGDYPCDKQYQLSVTYDGDLVSLNRENNTSMVLDFKNNEIYFDNYDRFIAHSFDVSPQELPHTSCYDENGQPIYIQRVVDKYNYTNGDPITIELNNYNIDIIKENDNYYVPLQTLGDLLINLQYCNILCNSEAIFVIDYETTAGEIGSEPRGLLAKYYEDETTVRSKELIDYTYNELCLFFDYNYGLKQGHLINDFNSYFTNTINNNKSLKEYLTSQDPFEFELGMAYLLCVDLNDVHSNYLAPSSYAGCASVATKQTTRGTDRAELFATYDKLGELQQKYYPNGIKQYEEIGNTAFIYFDNFLVSDTDYYVTEANADVADTIGLIIYAYQQIYRENSPIKNVVLDISMNTGGYENALAYVCGMFTGEYTFSIYNPITNAISNSRYRIDANLDHKFDDTDWFYDKNLYCITSPVSFSCSDLCATILKENNITMLGQKTGGGACVVNVFTTASGGWYCTSSCKQIVRNHLNSYYSIDNGIEVDYHFNSLDDYYDRQAIVKLINN